MYFTNSNPSALGGGAPGYAAPLTGGGAGAKGWTGPMGGASRAMSRSEIRNLGKTNMLTADIRAVCGPFRSFFNAGDVLGRNYQAGGPNAVVGVNVARNHSAVKNAGAISDAGVGKTETIGTTVFTSGNGAGQIPVQSGNPKFVYDGSDYIRYKKLAAVNQNYNDITFGGAGKSDMFMALNRVRG